MSGCLGTRQGDIRTYAHGPGTRPASPDRLRGTCVRDTPLRKVAFWVGSPSKTSPRVFAVSRTNGVHHQSPSVHSKGPPEGGVSSL